MDVLYGLSSQSDAVETFEEIVAQAEASSKRVVAALVGTDSASQSLETYMRSSQIADMMYQKRAYFMIVRPASFASGVGLSFKTFVDDEHKRTTGAGGDGFPAWSDSVPAVYVYQGCKSCVSYGEPAYVECAAKLTEFASAQALADAIKSASDW